MMIDPLLEALKAAHPELTPLPKPPEIVPDDLIKQQKPVEKQVIHIPANWSSSVSRRIIFLCCQFGEMTSEKMKSPDRYKHAVYWRHIAMHLMFKHTGYSKARIGRIIGGRDHTTVMSGLRKVETKYEEFRENIERVESSL